MIINAFLVTLVLVHAYWALQAGLPSRWQAWIIALPILVAGGILVHRARRSVSHASPILLFGSLVVADILLVLTIDSQGIVWLVGLIALQFFAATYVIARLANASVAQATLAVMSSEISLFGAIVVLAMMPASTAPESVTDVFYAGGPVTDPDLTYRYLPRTIFRHYYPDNANQYFEVLPGEMVDALNGWRMEGTAPSARLSVVLQPRPTVRVDFDARLSESASVSLGPFEISERRSASVRFHGRAAKDGQVEVSFHPEPLTASSIPTYRFAVKPDGEWHEWMFDLPARTERGRFHFSCDSSAEWMEIRDLRVSDQPDLTTLLIEPPTITPYFIEYRLNEAGFRDINWPASTEERTRIVCLGDSYTMGFGVNPSETFCRQLDRRLNHNGRRCDFELVNLGHPGYSTREERKLYEKWAPTLGGDIVLLTVVWNDDLAFVEEMAARQKDWESAGKKGSIFDLPRPRGDYRRCAEEILALDKFCRSRDARLVVVLYREEETEGDWDELARLIKEKLAGTKIPVCDLGAVLEQHEPELLRVHLADAHPNALAHRLAAEAIERCLRDNGLIRSEE